MWLTIRFMLMLSVTYFVRRLFGAPPRDAGGFVPRVVLPNALSLVAVCAVVTVVKFLASAGASIPHMPMTFAIIGLAQGVWLAFDWVRHDANRPARMP